MNPHLNPAKACCVTLRKSPHLPGPRLPAPEVGERVLLGCVFLLSFEPSYPTDLGVNILVRPQFRAVLYLIMRLIHEIHKQIWLHFYSPARLFLPDSYLRHETKLVKFCVLFCLLREINQQTSIFGSPLISQEKGLGKLQVWWSD